MTIGWISVSTFGLVLALAMMKPLIRPHAHAVS
jgi:hypothetical protein